MATGWDGSDRNEKRRRQKKRVAPAAPPAGATPSTPTAPLPPKKRLLSQAKAAPPPPAAAADTASLTPSSKKLLQDQLELEKRERSHREQLARDVRSRAAARDVASRDAAHLEATTIPKSKSAVLSLERKIAVANAKVAKYDQHKETMAALLTAYSANMSADVASYANSMKCAVAQAQHGVRLKEHQSKAALDLHSARVKVTTMEDAFKKASAKLKLRETELTAAQNEASAFAALWKHPIRSLANSGAVSPTAGGGRGGQQPMMPALLGSAAGPS